MQSGIGLIKTEIAANDIELASFLHQISRPVKGVWKNRVRWKDNLSIFARHPLRNKREEKTGKRAIWEKSPRY
jgi:hypothetical protein